MLTLAMEFSRCYGVFFMRARSEPKKMPVTCSVTDSLPRRARS